MAVCSPTAEPHLLTARRRSPSFVTLSDCRIDESEIAGNPDAEALARMMAGSVCVQMGCSDPNSIKIKCAPRPAGMLCSHLLLAYSPHTALHMIREQDSQTEGNSSARGSREAARLHPLGGFPPHHSVSYSVV